MSATDFDVNYVAHLARLHLTPEEEKKLGAQLSGILAYIEKLKELDVANVEPTAHAVPLESESPEVVHRFIETLRRAAE